jgi:hypothetical protein
MPYLNTFDQAAKHYASIARLRSPFGKAHDIRPIGKRNRRWERIAKLDDDTYVLLDGYTIGDRAFAPYLYGCTYEPTREDMEFFAAIVWKRHADGTETLKVRGAGVQVPTIGRLKFLNRHLPFFMGIDNSRRNGNHTLSLSRSMSGTGGLPAYTMLHRGNGAPEPVLEHLRATSVWAAGRMVPMQDDTGNVIFRRHADGRWELVSKRRGLMRWRTDKEAKAQIKTELRDFWAWGSIMLPMLLPMYADTRGAPDRPLLIRMAGGNLGIVDEPIMREVITTPDHPARVELLLWLAYTAVGWMWSTYPAADLIASAKRQADRVLGLYRKTEVEDFE